MGSRKFSIKSTTYAKNGRVLAIGYNSYTRTHPIMKHFANLVGDVHKEFLHSEVSAILRSGNVKIHSIRVERYGANGEPLLAKPCKICEAAIKAYGIKKVIHT
jgi:deoxycytidylate deaminase